MPDDAEDKTSSHDEEDVGRIQAIADYSRERVRVASVDISARVRDFDAKKAVDAVLEAPKRLKREWQKTGATGVITRFPDCNSCLVFDDHIVFCHNVRIP